MEIRLKIDDDFMENLKSNLNNIKTKQITEDALTLLNWAVSEVKQGRVIISTNQNGDEIKELAMPTLDRIKKV
jgi:hypothetical protein